MLTNYSGVKNRSKFNEGTRGEKSKVEMDSLESARRKPVSRGPKNVPRREDFERLRSLEKKSSWEGNVKTLIV